MGGLLNTSAFLRHNGLGTRSQLSAGKKITAANTFSTVSGKKNTAANTFSTVSSIVVAVCGVWYWRMTFSFSFFFSFFIFSVSFFGCCSVLGYGSRSCRGIVNSTFFFFFFLLWQCMGV